MYTFEPMDAVLLFRRWHSMKSRCYKPTDVGFHLYGGRGIKICDEWRDDFNAFFWWCINSGYHQWLELDRTDSNGDYTPENCRWSTKVANARNKRNTLHITAFEETKTVGEWLEDPRCKVGYTTFRHRLRVGWTGEKALITPENETVRHLVEAFGETKHIREWARDSRCVVSYKTLHSRITDGYAPEIALQTPLITAAMYAEQGKGNALKITAFGETKNVEEWARDSRCTVAAPTLWLRLFHQNLEPESAITKPNKRRQIS